MNDSLTVVLPTINEAGNLGLLIAELREQLAAASPEFLVVDGGSADATCEEARAAGATVLQDRAGYASSLLLGLREARTEWVLVMDADGSHTAEDARNLWDAREGADLVVGSRFATGGSLGGNPLRRWLSRLLAALFAACARLPARDMSSGFRLYRRALFAAAEVDARFFEVQPALLAWARREGARVREVGITYRPRGHGRSKARVLRYGMAFLGMLWRLRREGSRAKG
jgi:dolichol-phosphate mannosyltransferase